MAPDGAFASLDATLAAVGRELRDIGSGGTPSREAWKAACCVLLGLALSVALLEVDDVYWVAISAFMVTRASAAETAHRALLRILGTVGGVVTGLLLAPLSADDPVLLTVSMAVLGFVSLFQAQISRNGYAWVFFGLTALLVLTTSLSTPQSVIPFASVRIVEIGLGAAAGSIVTLLFALVWPAPAPPSAASIPGSPLWKGVFEENWLAERWPLIHQAARGGLALGLLPLIWRLIGLQDITGTAVTSFVVMVVPAVTILDHGDVHRAARSLRDRGMHRLVGCLLGGSFALVGLSVVTSDVLPSLLLLFAGVWIGARIQNGTEGASYCGTQFAIAFLITLVQGNGPATGLMPAIDRFEGILIGVAVLALITSVWPLPDQGADQCASQRAS